MCNKGTVKKVLTTISVEQNILRNVHTMEVNGGQCWLVTNVLQNIVCVLFKIEGHTGLKWHSFLVNYPFTVDTHINAGLLSGPSKGIKQDLSGVMAFRVRLLYLQSKGLKEMEGVRDREGTLKQHLFESIDKTIRETQPDYQQLFLRWPQFLWMETPEDVKEGPSSSSSIVGPYPTARALGALLWLMEFIGV